MRLPLIPIIVVLLLGVALTAYVVRRGRRDGWLRHRRARIAFWALPAIATVLMAVVAFSSKKDASDSSLLFFMWTVFAYFSVFLPILILALAALVRRFLCKKAVTWVGAALAGALFVMMWWGALFTRFELDVRRVEVPVAGLPPAFDGYRIAQISDIHTGSYGDDPDFLAKMVDTVNSLHPDIILFTGDIVNRHSSELIPFLATLGSLEAPDGVWSVMGNHDYGEYRAWASESDRLADVANLKDLERRMGWRMLNNESHTLRRGSDSIVLVGVENIGDPPFTTYGSLETAYPAIGDSAVKILMSHNPAHWVDSIAGRRDANVALTLAGHTHAMQMRVFGWSPASMRYSTWGGLYPDSLGRYLYVNIGIGEVGFPSRIGATPEITLITLRPVE